MDIGVIGRLKARSVTLVQDELAILGSQLWAFLGLLPLVNVDWLSQLAAHLRRHRRIKLPVDHLHGSIYLDRFLVVQFIQGLLVCHRPQKCALLLDISVIKCWIHEIFDYLCGRIKGFFGDCLRIGLR